MSRVLAAFVGAGLALAALAGPARAQDKPPRDLSDTLRPCTRANLLGTWEVVRMGAAPGFTFDRAGPEYRPFQRYVFDANATMRHLTSETAITPDEHRALVARAAAAIWAVDETGRLQLLKDGAARPETATCVVLLKDVVSRQGGIPGLPGDLLLTHADASGRAVVRRQLRRLAEP
ncbi:MAG: hypothetical protein HY729_10945 [Candidatus Rokubacteria bacterium]|nr:hypothetical protein [Candidatus Rokubacteria bacterium]